MFSGIMIARRTLTTPITNGQKFSIFQNQGAGYNGSNEGKIKNLQGNNAAITALYFEVIHAGALVPTTPLEAAQRIWDHSELRNGMITTSIGGVAVDERPGWACCRPGAWITGTNNSTAFAELSTVRAHNSGWPVPFPEIPVSAEQTVQLDYWLLGTGSTALVGASGADLEFGVAFSQRSPRVA